MNVDGITYWSVDMLSVVVSLTKMTPALATICNFREDWSLLKPIRDGMLMAPSYVGLMQSPQFLGDPEHNGHALFRREHQQGFLYFCFLTTGSQCVALTSLTRPEEQTGCKLAGIFLSAPQAGTASLCQHASQ